MTIELTDVQFQAFVGMMDVAVKSLGIRALEDDVVGVMAALKAGALPEPFEPIEA